MLILDTIPDPTFPHDSQTSSGSDSSASQASHTLFNLKDASQSSVEQGISQEASLTLYPPAFIQSSPAMISNGNGQDQPRWAAAGSHQTKARSSTIDAQDAMKPLHSVETTHGQKRTASGHVKSPSLPISPSNSVPRGHSRKASTASNSSQIGEVSPPSLSCSSCLTRFSCRPTCAHVLPTQWSKCKKGGKPERSMKSKP